ncbi:transient receptor potential cation channel subfamily A member 1-like [Montipora capricornis]|uniref:transient receptor potential cation channel subfamily A member 1-like n=1 Tax=Montipora capricornis TaxID=246305 RepID=UPI0035F1FB9C
MIELTSSFCGSMYNSGNLEKLQQAIREKNFAYLRQCSQTGQDLNTVDGSGFSPLHHASSRNDIEMISTLLDCEASINCQGEHLLTPLHVAVRYNSFEAVKTLMEYDADPSIKNSDGATPLHYAARRGCVDTLKLLIRNASSSVNCRDHSGMTPFHFACVSGSETLCELLIEHKADIFARTVEEKNPLHLAALYGNKAIVEILLRKAFEEVDNHTHYINAPDFEGNTPLHFASQKGHVGVAKLLLSYGSEEVNWGSQWDLHVQSPLHLAAANGHVGVVELLISRNAPVDSRDELQRTPLHRAAEFNRVGTVKYLLKAGADIEAKDISNRTAFIYAVKRGRTNIAELLLESGADFESRDESRRSCIHLAVQHEREGTLCMLLKHDRDELINEKDKDLQTPLHYAARLGVLKILQILLENKCIVAPKDAFERSPLHTAAANGHVFCTEELCKSEPGHINDKDDRGLTALHLAARGNHRDTCALLRDLGAHTMTRDSNRWTALHHCAAGGCARTTASLLVYHSALSLGAADQDGNTPLHVAARCGHVSAVQMMISRGADITACNEQMMTCLDIAVEFGKEKVAEVLIKNDKWKDILQCKAFSGINPMKGLIQTMPKLAGEVLDRCVTHSDLPRHHPDYFVEFDFSLLASCDIENEEDNKSHGDSFFGPAVMVEWEREDLLMHPLTQALLQWKWRTVGLPLFWINFLSYLAFVCLFTVFATTERGKQLVHKANSAQSDQEDHKIFRYKNSFSTGTPVVIAIFIFIHMMRELYQIGVQRWRYLTHFTNFIEWTCYLSALCFVIPYFVERNVFSKSMALWPLASIVTLLSYISLVLFLRRFFYFGIYISMFFEVTRTFLRVVVVFTPIIFAFSMAFFLLLKEQDSFTSLWWSLAKTTIMMIGEIDYGSIIIEAKEQVNERNGAPLLPIPEFTAFIVVLFCMMVSVLLMNLLVGLAVGDIDSIQRDANMRRLATQVEFVTDIDQRYPRFLRKYLHKSVLTVRPNQRSSLEAVLKKTVDLFSKSSSKSNGSSNSDEASDESADSSVSAEVAEQRVRLDRLCNVVEDQSRLLREIYHHLQQTAPTAVKGILESGVD